MLHKLILIAAISAFLAPANAVSQSHGADDAAIVTVTGEIAKTNRGAFDPFSDAFFAHHEVSFQRAYAFTRADLAALGMEEIVLRYPSWPAGEMTLRGPSLAAVLEHVAARASAVTVRALDGYAFRFEVETMEADRLILAIERDGRPLAIGGRGPAWLVFPPDALPGPKDQAEIGLVWSAFHIAVD